VHRLVGQEQQDRGADISTLSPPAATPTASPAVMLRAVVTVTVV